MTAGLLAVANPFAGALMQRALLEVILIGLAGGALGCWVIHYELSYAAESLAHSIFPGLVIAALVGLPLLIGGVIGIAAAALAVALASRVPGISREVAVAIVVTTLFGVGALLALSPESPPGIQGLLFGDILGPSDSDLLFAGVLAALILAALVVVHPLFLAVGFDRGSASSLGLSTALADALLLGLLAAAILVAVQGLGNLLVVAVLVGPAAAARRISTRMGPMMVAAGGIATCAGAAGLLLSFYAGTAAGASVAGMIVVAYLTAHTAGELRSR